MAEKKSQQKRESKGIEINEPFSEQVILPKFESDHGKPDPTVPSASTLMQHRSTQQLDVTITHVETEQEPCCTRFKRFCYDSNAGTICGRTCKSWAKIFAYAIMYLIFLITFFNIILYISLVIIEYNAKTRMSYAFEALIESLPDTIGLSGTPLSEFNFPLIWYRNGVSADYERYVLALDDLLTKNPRRNDVESKLGPCGQRPYGYGDQPCILVRINRQLHWAAKPLQPNSPKVVKAPKDIQKWVKSDSKKYWLHCEGYQNYDKEHIGTINYYPNPPGFESKLFPLRENSSAPLVAVQLSNFTLGISLAVHCSVWYEAGSSSIDFMLYISPRSKI